MYHTLLAVLLASVGLASPLAAQSHQGFAEAVTPVFKPVAPATVVASGAEMAAAQTRPAGGLIPDAWRPRSTRLNWIDYSILAATGAAAVLAIRYKFEADDLYEDYQATGDPALRPRIKALDVRSGIATGAMQVGVVTFGARLLLR